MERFLVHRSLCDWELWTTSQVMHIFFPRNWWLSGVWLCVNLELDYWRILCPMTAMTWSGGLEPMHLSSSPKCKRIDGWMESCKGNALRYWPKIGMSWYQPFCLISVFLKNGLVEIKNLISKRDLARLHNLHWFQKQKMQHERYNGLPWGYTFLDGRRAKSGLFALISKDLLINFISFHESNWYF